MKDPNTTLARMRELVARSGQDGLTEEEAEEFYSAFAELDQHLTEERPPPNAWMPKLIQATLRFRLAKMDDHRARNRFFLEVDRYIALLSNFDCQRFSQPLTEIQEENIYTIGGVGVSTDEGKVPGT